MAPQNTQQRDFLTHLETYIAKRDGVDKLLKLTRYTSKLILSSNSLPHAHPFTRQLKTFESNLGISRKAFRLGKFIQDVNALRSSARDTPRATLHHFLTILAYGGEGVYYFIEQIVWLTKSGLINTRHAREISKLSAWAELIGYIGSIALKMEDLSVLNEKLLCLRSSMGIAVVRGEECAEEKEKMKVLEMKLLLKRLSILQDFADALMAVADIRDGKGKIFSPVVISSAGLLSAVISTHKNWVTC